VRVHIVITQIDNDTRILPRKTRALADGLGWSLGNTLDKRADLTYLFPYLEYDRVGRLDGPTMGYFTHRDKPRPGKVEMWEAAAKAVDLRLTSSSHNLQYLERHGPTRLVVPPLDRTMFHVGLVHNHAHPVIGTSGYVYAGQRKGEALIAGLRESQEAKGCEMRAIGRGWPIPTQGLFWEQVPAWYQDLDVYVCTSMIEGVGYGPLEALACGIPCIVPRGVGIFDDLPDCPGLYRYAAGSLLGLRAALAVALTGDPIRGDLRALTEPYTAERWCADHLAAAESLLAGQPSAPADYSSLPSAPTFSAGTDAEVTAANWKTLRETLDEGTYQSLVAEHERLLARERYTLTPPGTGQAGLYVVAFGDPSRKCADRCIKAFKKHNPSVPVMLCSDRPLGPEDLLAVQPDRDVGGRQAKLMVDQLAPPDWEYILYLDADTEPTGNLGVLFDWLRDGWEFVIAKNPVRFAIAQNMVRPDNQKECDDVFALWGSDQMMQWNGGVFAFRRCPRVDTFMARWREEWQRLGGRDQPPLLRTLWALPLRAMWLTNLWNCDPKYASEYDRQHATILHHAMEARRWRGIIDGRTDTPAAWKAVEQWSKTKAGAR
jgi:hypothetical protein